jgi:hypothetical protein
LNKPENKVGIQVYERKHDYKLVIGTWKTFLGKKLRVYFSKNLTEDLVMFYVLDDIRFWELISAKP